MDRISDAVILGGHPNYEIDDHDDERQSCKNQRDQEDGDENINEHRHLNIAL